MSYKRNEKAIKLLYTVITHVFHVNGYYGLPGWTHTRTQTDRQTERQTDRHTHTHTNMHTYRCTNQSDFKKPDKCGPVCSWFKKISGFTINLATMYESIILYMVQILDEKLINLF